MPKIIKIEVTDLEYEALKLRSAQKVLRIDEESILAQARFCIVELLAMEDRLSFEDVLGIVLTETVKTETKTVPTGEVIAAKARQERRVENRAVLEAPVKLRSDKVTAVWKSWAWIVKAELDSSTWSTFTNDNVSQGAKMDKKDVYSSLAALQKPTSRWIYESGTGRKKTAKGSVEFKVYSLTEAAKTWLKQRTNQTWLIDQGVIEPIREADAA